jgi:hypothetical protein
MAIDPKKPFSYKVEIDGLDKLGKGLSRSEAHYYSLSKSLGKVSESVKDTDSKFTKFAHGVKVAAQATYNFAKDAVTHAKPLVWAWTKVTSLFGAFSIVGIITKSIHAFLDFDKVLRGLNVTLYGNGKAMGVSAGLLHQYRGMWGMTREEIADTIKQITELKVFDNTQKGATNLKLWTKEVILLSKATDTSTGELNDMYFSVNKLGRVPIEKFKNIGSAFSYIQKQTALSGSELAAYVKSLDQIFIRLPITSKETRTKMTVELMALGGVIKDAMGDPQAMMGTFSKMMHLGSKEGEAALAELSALGGRSMDSLFTSLRSGDVVGVYKEMALALKGVSREERQLFSEQFSERLGISYEQMEAMVRSVEKGGKAFDAEIDKARRASDAQNKHHSAAQARQNQLLVMWNKLKNAFEDLFIKFGEGLTRAATTLLKTAMPHIEKALNWLTEKINWLNSPEGKDWIDSWCNKLIEVTSKAASFLLEKVINPIVQGVTDLINWWGKLSGTEKTIVKWAAVIGVAIAALGIKLTVIAAAIYGVYKAYRYVYGEMADERERAARAQQDTEKDIAALRMGSKETAQRSIGGRHGFYNEAGNVNTAELVRRADIVAMGDFNKREALVKEWSNKLEAMKETETVRAGTVYHTNKALEARRKGQIYDIDKAVPMQTWGKGEENETMGLLKQLIDGVKGVQAGVNKTADNTDSIDNKTTRNAYASPLENAISG